LKSEKEARVSVEREEKSDSSGVCSVVTVICGAMVGKK